MKLKTKKVKGWCSGAGKWVELKKRKYVRCPVCRKRLLAGIVYEEPERSFGIEIFLGFKIPPHKEK